MTNIRHFSKANSIAAASPLIGAYLLSASIQNLLPANIRCHPSGQQTGALSVVHEQCFCNRRKPIPSLLISGARQVMRFFSNVAMPFRTRSTMTCLECWNAASRPWSQAKSESRLTRSRKGSMTGPSEYAQATWLTCPNHDLASVSVFGIGKLVLLPAWA